MGKKFTKKMQIIDRQQVVRIKKRPGSVLPSPRRYIEVYKMVSLQRTQPGLIGSIMTERRNNLFAKMT